MTVKEKILKIMSLALEINPPEVKNIGQKKTAVFVNWSPHCPLLRCTIHFGGWKPFSNLDEDFDVYTDWKGSEKELDKIIKRLEEIREAESEI